jgi:hypothetical protein
MQIAKNLFVDWPEVDLELSLKSRLPEGERGGPSSFQAFGPQSHLAGTGMPYAVQSDSLIGVLVFSNVVFNLTDLATTFAAVGRGLAGVGPLVTSMSSMLGLSLLAALAMTTAFLVMGAVVIALVGVRSVSKGTRKLALGYLLASTLVFYVISLNNIVWLVT